MVERRLEGDVEPLKIQIARHAHAFLEGNETGKIPVEEIISSLGERAANLTVSDAEKLLRDNFANVFKFNKGTLTLSEGYSLADFGEEIDMVVNGMRNR